MYVLVIIMMSGRSLYYCNLLYEYMVLYGTVINILGIYKLVNTVQ